MKPTLVVLAASLLVIAVLMTIADVRRCDKERDSWLAAFKNPRPSYWLVAGGLLACLVGLFGVKV